ncbi:MAG: hypothetical protein MK212_04975 [Saprospiraceae bacterium]|nr:hypothetical protein [Saprospiraceae bacterium]
MGKYLFSLILISLLLGACKRDKCKNIICDNGGTCIEGTCECLVGWTGETCSETDLASETVVEIPIIFHIIHNGESIGQGSNIHQDTIIKQLSLLNRNYRNSLGLSYGLDMNVQFRLATQDTNGTTLAEAGINRIYRPETQHVGEGALFSETWIYDSMWDLDQYVNVWVAVMEDEFSWGTLPYTMESNPLVGLSQVPNVFLDAVPAYTEGLIIHQAHLFTEDAAILTHEMGHYLGLKHSFDDEGCDTEDDDHCEDTPLYDRSAYNILLHNFNRVGCDGTIFAADNYMDYYRRKNLRFTENQKSRIRHVVAFSPHRGTLRSSFRSNQKKPWVGTLPPKPKIQSCQQLSCVKHHAKCLH